MMEKLVKIYKANVISWVKNDKEIIEYVNQVKPIQVLKLSEVETFQKSFIKTLEQRDYDNLNNYNTEDYYIKSDEIDIVKYLFDNELKQLTQEAFYLPKVHEKTFTKKKSSCSEKDKHLNPKVQKRDMVEYGGVVDCLSEKHEKFEAEDLYPQSYDLPKQND